MFSLNYQLIKWQLSTSTPPFSLYIGASCKPFPFITVNTKPLIFSENCAAQSESNVNDEKTSVVDCSSWSVDSGLASSPSSDVKTV